MKWNEIHDIRPVFGIDVLVFGQYKPGGKWTVAVGHLHAIVWDANGESQKWYDDGTPLFGVTHWMPLPEPPKQEQ